MTRPYPVYIVDDDPGIRELISDICEEAGLAPRGFGGGEEFLAELDGLAAGCILLDMRMPGKNGLQVQEDLVKRKSRMPVVAITGYSDVEMAVQSMKLGALEFLEKPFSNQVLLDAVNLAMQKIAREEGD